MLQWAYARRTPEGGPGGQRCPVGVIHRQDAYLSPAARRLIEVLKATAREITEGKA